MMIMMILMTMLMIMMTMVIWEYNLFNHMIKDNRDNEMKPAATTSWPTLYSTYHGFHYASSGSNEK